MECPRPPAELQEPGQAVEPRRQTRRAFRSPFPNTRPLQGKENRSDGRGERPLDHVSEDSGFSSLQSSLFEDESRGSPTIFSPPLTRGEGSPVKMALSRRLPGVSTLDIQREVSEKLARPFKPTQSYDWSFLSEDAEHSLVDPVIGGQAGEKFVDVLSSLHARNERVILAGVLALLGDRDLLSCRKVSRTWRTIICEDAAALRRCERAEQTFGSSRLARRLTRGGALTRRPLTSIQPAASPSYSSSSSTPLSGASKQYSRFECYLEASRKLKQHESLRSCKRCRSPAAYDSKVQRAKCTSRSCLFDFCTHCLGAYHGSSTCPRVSHASGAQILPGSARSKRNLRRL
ncbi:F-box only protein 5-like [Neosynchiropus ocellatus]